MFSPIFTCVRVSHFALLFVYTHHLVVLHFKCYFYKLILIWLMHLKSTSIPDRQNTRYILIESETVIFISVHIIRKSVCDRLVVKQHSLCHEKNVFGNVCNWVWAQTCAQVLKWNNFSHLPSKIWSIADTVFIRQVIKSFRKSYGNQRNRWKFYTIRL